MATISNLELGVIDAATPDERLVTVTYELSIPPKEALAGTVFLETISLWGDDRTEGGDVDFLRKVRNRLIKADELGAGTHVRTVTRKISKQTLDEDAEITSGGQDLDVDELFARVSVRPFVAKSAEMDSDTVRGLFGPEGSG